MMNKNKLKEVVYDQIGLFKNRLNYVEREIPADCLKTKKIFIITGIRRSGKSTLLKQIADSYKNFYYFNFEDERLLDFTKDDFNSLWEIFLELFGKRPVVFFDEIQYVFGWEKFISRLFNQGYKIFITGSSANLLSREMATALTGRHLKTELYPFSFKEFLKYHKVEIKANQTTAERAKMKKYFNLYLEYGGFPEIVISQDKNELKQLYQDVIIRDLLVRFKIKEVKAFRELALYLISNIASPVSFNNLKKILGFKSVTSVKNYVEFLEEAYLIFSLSKYDYSLKRQIINDRKIYGIDLGLIRETSFNFSKNSGRFLENLVFLELKRRCREIYYYKNKLECDFLIRQGLKISAAIQVSQELNLNNRSREINGLVAALKEYKLTEGLILTYDQEEEIIVDKLKITCRPVWKWLLE